MPGMTWSTPHTPDSSVTAALACPGLSCVCVHADSPRPGRGAYPCTEGQRALGRGAARIHCTFLYLLLSQFRQHLMYPLLSQSGQHLMQLSGMLISLCPVTTVVMNGVVQ